LSRLLILWLLSEAPLHGYRITKILNDPSLRFWFPLESSSIYAVFGSLVRGGFIEPEIVEREGLRPERTRYRITKSGRTHLQELLRQAWRELPRLADPINVALAARSELTEEEVKQLLEARFGSLLENLNEMERVASSAPAKEMVTRQQALFRAELEWVESMLREMAEA
jgi:DNA-binding PadR family transcriptional regulator